MQIWREIETSSLWGSLCITLWILWWAMWWGALAFSKWRGYRATCWSVRLGRNPGCFSRTIQVADSSAMRHWGIAFGMVSTTLWWQRGWFLFLDVISTLYPLYMTILYSLVRFFGVDVWVVHHACCMIRIVKSAHRSDQIMRTQVRRKISGIPWTW